MNTKVLERERLEYHPSFHKGMPRIVAEPEPVGYCHTCEGLAGQIRASERLGDRDGMVAYGWQAIRHVAAVHS